MLERRLRDPGDEGRRRQGGIAYTDDLVELQVAETRQVPQPQREGSQGQEDDDRIRTPSSHSK